MDPDRHPTSEARASRPRRRWLLLAILVLALAALGLYWYLGRDDVWHAAVAEADAQDPNWRLGDQLDALPRLRDSENSAIVVIRAIGLIPPNWPAEDLYPLLENQTPTRVLDENQLKRLREELAKARPALTVARTLADMPHGRHPIRYKPDVLSTLLPTVQDSRRVYSLLAYDALGRAQEGDLEGAFVSCRAMLNTGRSTGEEPLIICHLVRIASVADAVRTLERILAQGEVAEPSLAAMQRLFEEEETQPLLLISARGERGALPHMLNALEKGDMTIDQALAAISSSRGDKATMLQVFTYKFVPGRVRGDFGHLMRLENRWVECARLPVERQLAAVKELEREEAELPLLARSMAPSFGKITQAFLRRHASLRCAIAALAGERFRLTHGRWPDSLEQLVPGFLPKAPLDPFDGKLLRFRRTEDGVVIYSVGPDGQDNEALLERQSVSRKAADIGFQLWDTGKRRQR